MACFSPLQGYRSSHLTKNGKRSIVFSPSSAVDSGKLFQVTVSCGQCVGCRLERSRQWAIRCVHEASLFKDKNCFITLTYSDEHLPPSSSLEVRHFQLFMKRLRKRFSGFYPVVDKKGVETFPIRFFHCGEYGSLHGRPHYHACLFNFDFDDKVLHKVQANGSKLYRSPSLEELWPYGHSSIGTVSFESAAYVARYIMKKVTGAAAVDHYLNIDESTGEVFTIKPEYTTMSRRPGIGKAWIDEYMSDVYPGDFVLMKRKSVNVQIRPPKFYDSQFELLYPEEFESIKTARKRNSIIHAVDNTRDRLKVREVCVEAKLKLLPRNLDSDSHSNLKRLKDVIHKRALETYAENNSASNDVFPLEII